MNLLAPILLLGFSITVSVFLITWNFRGRGFGELAFWRREASSPPRESSRPEAR